MKYLIAFLLTLGSLTAYGIASSVDSIPPRIIIEGVEYRLVTIEESNQLIRDHFELVSLREKYSMSQEIRDSLNALVLSYEKSYLNVIDAMNLLDEELMLQDSLYNNTLKANSILLQDRDLWKQRALEGQKKLNNIKTQNKIILGVAGGVVLALIVGLVISSAL